MAPTSGANASACGRSRANTPAERWRKSPTCERLGSPGDSLGMTTLLGISIKRAFGDVRLKLSGELDRSNLQALDDAFASAERRAKRIVIDLAELTFIDGGGLRALQQAGERAKVEGHQQVLEIDGGERTQPTAS